MARLSLQDIGDIRRALADDVPLSVMCFRYQVRPGVILRGLRRYEQSLLRIQKVHAEIQGKMDIIDISNL